MDTIPDSDLRRSGSHNGGQSPRRRAWAKFNSRSIWAWATVANLCVVSAALSYGASNFEGETTPAVRHADAKPLAGQTTMVSCAANANQRYSVYLPSNYDPSKPMPILYAFHPRALGNVLVDRFRDACEKHGWIVVGSMNSRNGPPQAISVALHAIWNDTHERFNLSRKSHYATGFSGGARVSFSLARMHKGMFAGVIAMGAGVNADEVLPEKEIAVFVTCGETDFNRDPELEFWLVPSLRINGNAHKFRTFPGGHVIAPKEIVEEAVDWLVGLRERPGNSSGAD